jgi:hypothetical protein
VPAFFILHLCDHLAAPLDFFCPDGGSLSETPGIPAKGAWKMLPLVTQAVALKQAVQQRKPAKAASPNIDASPRLRPTARSLLRRILDAPTASRMRRAGIEIEIRRRAQDEETRR